MRINAYCECGGGVSGFADAKSVARVIEAWKKVHNGPNCKPCDRATAIKALERGKLCRQSSLESDSR